MSLRRNVCACTAAAALLWAVPGHSDVLEVGEEGARWVAGEQAAQFANSSADEALPTDDEFLLLADDAAESDSSRSARHVPAAYAAAVAELAHRFDLSPALIEALVWQESRWRASAVSHKGARGFGQLMPGTARELGVNPDDPRSNLEGAARYLRAQLDRFDGDLELALAAYNAGPVRVARAGGVPRIRETQNYVAAVMGRLSDHSRE